MFDRTEPAIGRTSRQTEAISLGKLRLTSRQTEAISLGKLRLSAGLFICFLVVASVAPRE